MTSQQTQQLGSPDLDRHPVAQASSNTDDLAERYVGVWTESDPDTRRRAIRALWAPRAAHVLLDPSQEIRNAAASIGFAAPVLEARGYEELEARVTRAYEEFVAPGRFTFRSRHNGSRLDNVVTFNWEMVPVEGGAPEGVGLEILILDDNDRIRMDYQLILG
jgi:hypothetical protein